MTWARAAFGALVMALALGTATHLTFLTINRPTLYGTDRNSGWSADLTTPDAILLISSYLLLIATICRLLGRSLNSAHSKQSKADVGSGA